LREMAGWTRGKGKGKGKGKREQIRHKTLPKLLCRGEFLKNDYCYILLQLIVASGFVG
jgi:hypothetical protein